MILAPVRGDMVAYFNLLSGKIPLHRRFLMFGFYHEVTISPTGSVPGSFFLGKKSGACRSFMP
ncbi:hypothetical protein [Akkermansia sp.]|uniref:hypothetical protein n=1 Tax=Akkermansia sp. TaxID=1872421 RepID=UPI001B6517C1|nr:hypothetical protein [Akkermansia sp.]MBP8662938.1 hypothetical protein [Akkermansia sp.]